MTYEPELLNYSTPNPAPTSAHSAPTDESTPAPIKTGTTESPSAASDSDDGEDGWKFPRYHVEQTNNGLLV